MAHRDPGIHMTTTTSHPVTHTTTSTYTIGGRRNRHANRDSAASDEAYLAAPTPTYDIPEPFPALSPAPTNLQSTRTNDYFSQPPLQYQIRSRPIGIRRLPSSNDVDQTSSRPHGGSLTRRRTNTAPSQRQPPENATAGLAALPGHYDIGAQPGMETIGEDQEAHHGQPRNSTEGVGRSGSTRLRRLSNAASTAAKSITSRLSDDTEEQKMRSRRNTRDYESDVVDYLDVLGKSFPSRFTSSNLSRSRSLNPDHSEQRAECPVRPRYPIP